MEPVLIVFFLGGVAHRTYNLQLAQKYLSEVWQVDNVTERDSGSSLNAVDEGAPQLTLPEERRTAFRVLLSSPLGKILCGGDPVVLLRNPIKDFAIVKVGFVIDGLGTENLQIPLDLDRVPINSEIIEARAQERNRRYL